MLSHTKLVAARKLWLTRYKTRRAYYFSLKAGHGKHTSAERTALLAKYLKLTREARHKYEMLDGLLHPSREAQLRAKIVEYALWGIAHAPQIHYSMGSERMAHLHDIEHLPLSTDCSGSTTLYYSWAGAPDPNGLGYDGSGNTQTMFAHMARLATDAGKPADLVVYNPTGPLSTQHVVVILENLGHSQYIVASHGQEDGPFKISHETEWDAHGRHVNGFAVLTLPSWK